MSRHGKYIVIEGLDGSGKSTQHARLLDSLGDKAIGVREPGDTPMAEQLRTLIKDKSLPRDPHTNLWLFMSSRVDLVNQVIRPNVEAGKHVIADRNWLATVAYQSAEGVNTDDIYTLAKLATKEFFQPDLLIFIDITDETRRERTTARGGHEQDYFDGLSSDYFAKVRQGYLDNLKQVDNHIIIDGNGTPDEVEALVTQQLQAILQEE